MMINNYYGETPKIPAVTSIYIYSGTQTAEKCAFHSLINFACYVDTQKISPAKN